MKRICKRVFAMLATLVLLLSSFSTAYAMEATTDVRKIVEESSVMPRAAVTIYHYENGRFNDSAVKYFESPMSGKAGIALIGMPTDGTSDGKIKATLYAKNILENYAEIASHEVDANGEASYEYCDWVYKGDDLMLVITTTSDKDMVVVAEVIVQV